MIKVGWVGLGAMGAPMAAHLHRAGLLVAVCNRSHAKAERFAAAHAGVLAVRDPAELPQLCEVVVSAVSADADVLGLAHTLAQHADPGLVLIDTSTIAAASAEKAAWMLRSHGADFLDCPVSGGVEGAIHGRLSVMAGGEEETLAEMRPVLDCFAARVTHMGPVGAGQSSKAVNQVLVAGIAAAVCEGLALGEALGLPRERLLPTLLGGAAQCWFLDKRGESMLDNRFELGFKLSLLCKDLGIVQALATAAGVDHSVVDKALADYTELQRRGHGNEDISALIRLKRRSEDR
ncbi:MAG: NAD(P)-dependent oxidoreductase [Lysobacterales bacterium]